MRENGTRYWHRTNSILRLYYALIQRRDDDLPFIEESLWLTREIRRNGPDFRTGYARNSGIQRMLTFRNERREYALGYTHRPRVGIRWTPSWVSMSPISDRKGPPPNIWGTSRQCVNILWRLLAGILTIQSNCFNCSTSDRSVAQLFTEAINEAVREYYISRLTSTNAGGHKIRDTDVATEHFKTASGDAEIGGLLGRKTDNVMPRMAYMPEIWARRTFKKRLALTHRMGYWS